MANALNSLFALEESDSEHSVNSENQRYKTSYQNDYRPLDSVKGKGWIEVNKSLRKHGLSVVQVIPLSQASRSTGSKFICLDENTSEKLCGTLLTLILDGDQRQKLIHDLIQRNDQLKEDLDKQTELSERYHQKVKDLKVMLEASRNTVMELEESRRITSYLSDDERSPKTILHSRCNQLKKTCQLKEKQIEKLQRKLKKLTDEDEKRSLRQSQIFQEFKKRTARAHNAMDEKLLDVIDSYECQLDELRKELDISRDNTEKNLSDNLRNGLSLHGSGSHGLIKTYEKQLKESKKQIKNLQEQNEVLKLEIEGRPLMKDYRLAQQRIKKLEKVIISHKISVPGEKNTQDPFHLKRKYSTHIEDIESLPPANCQKILKDICHELNVEDLKEILPCIHGQQKQDQLDANSSAKFENFTVEVHELVQSLSELSGSRRRRRAMSIKADRLTEETLDQDLSVVEHWAEDAKYLPDLQDSISHLAKKVAPWLRLHMTDNMSVSKLVSMVDRLTEDEETHTVSGKNDEPPKKQLKNIVSHFQMLFEVPHISGVFARMNDVYVKYGEIQNVLHTLRNILGLKDDAKSTAIVDAVGKLCHAHNSSTSEQLRRLLQTDDLDSVIKRLEEHTLFFPVFHEVMRKLLEILGLERMDQVIPAVRALKLLAV